MGGHDGGAKFGPHKDPSECPTWNDGCNCTPETCAEVWKQLDEAEARVAELEANLEGASGAKNELSQMWGEAEARVAELEARERRLWAVLERVSRGYIPGSRARDFVHDRDLDALCAAVGVEDGDE